jgi:putative DNA primase/helicase
MGAGKWRDTYSECLLGRHVIVLADADTPGRRHAHQVAGSVQGVAASVKLLELPESNDLSDWLALGHGRPELEALLASALPYVPPPPGVNGHKPDTRQGQADTEHHTDLGLAKRLVKLHGQDMRYVWPWAKWLCWNGQRWEPDDTGRVVSWCKDAVKGIYADAQAAYVEATSTAASDTFDPLKGTKNPAKERADALYAWAVKSEAAARISAAIDLARSEPGVPVRPEAFDADPWVLNVQNGTLDLHTCQIHPHRREDLLTKLAPVQYDPAAKLELWDSFLAEAIPDLEQRRYMQKAAGSCLTGEAPDDVLLFLYGPGGSGKGTFSGAIQSTLGDYATTAELSTFVTDRNSTGPRPDLAALRAVRMVVIEEVDDRQPGIIAMLKKASGGTAIATRSHHQETFTFKPQFKLWLLGNKRPRFPDDDTGIWRRLRVLPFTHVFNDPDPTIRKT